MKFKFRKELDYIVGHLRYGHIDGTVEADNLEEEKGSEVIINFTDTWELENFIMALTQLKEMTKGYYGKWEIEKGKGERLWQ